MKRFILYDGRAKYVGTEHAIEMDIANSEREAQLVSDKSYRGVDAVWFEYDMVDGEATMEKVREDIGKGILL